MAWLNLEALNIVSQWRCAYIAPILIALPVIYGVWRLFLRKPETSKKSTNKKKRVEKQAGVGLKTSTARPIKTQQKESRNNGDDEKLIDKGKLEVTTIKDKVNEPFVLVKGKGKKKDNGKNGTQQSVERHDEIVETETEDRVDKKSIKPERLNGVKKDMTVTAPRKKYKAAKGINDGTLPGDSTRSNAASETVVAPNTSENEEEWQEVRSRKKVLKQS